MQNNYKPVSLLNVSLKFEKKNIAVGRLALSNNRIYFEYDLNFIKKGLEISPFKLPLKEGLQQFDVNLFEGLAGVFNDSLPDGWGRLLLDRSLKSKEINPSSFSALDRLAHVGQSAMGALCYEPDHSEAMIKGNLSLDKLSAEAIEVLSGDESIFFAELLALNGSSAGARPKALIGVNDDKSSLSYGVTDLPKEFEHWLVKFPNTQDKIEAGAIEFTYSQMATLSGVKMEETYLFPAKKGPGYFATKRFDRSSNNRLHMHTVSGLIHSDFRVPALDYKDLVKITMSLTKKAKEVEKLYRLAVFNVLAHNQDDHGKNFSFLMNKKGDWILAPAYDLTFSSGPAGEQSTMVMGEGKNPNTLHLKKLAEFADINQTKSKAIIKDTIDALSKWKELAQNAGVSKNKISEIDKVLSRNLK